MPEDRETTEYWVKRRKNNEAAKRSREKRKRNDVLLERRVVQLTEENKKLRAQLQAIKIKYGELNDTYPPITNLSGSMHSPRQFTSKIFLNASGDTSATVHVNKIPASFPSAFNDDKKYHYPQLNSITHKAVEKLLNFVHGGEESALPLDTTVGQRDNFYEIGSDISDGSIHSPEECFMLSQDIDVPQVTIPINADILGPLGLKNTALSGQSPTDLQGELPQAAGCSRVDVNPELYNGSQKEDAEEQREGLGSQPEPRLLPLPEVTLNGGTTECESSLKKVNDDEPPPVVVPQDKCSHDNIRLPHKLRLKKSGRKPD